MAQLLIPKPQPFATIFVPCDERMPEKLPPLLIDEAWQMERVMILIPLPEKQVTFKVGSA